MVHEIKTSQSSKSTIVLKPSLLQCFVDSWFVILIFIISISIGLFVKVEYANLIGGIGCLITCILLIYQLIYYLSLSITITEQEIIEKRGILSWRKDHIELYRINDYDESVNWREMILGLKTVHISSTDRSRPDLYIIGVPRNYNVISELRNRVKKCKNENHIFEAANR